MPVQGPHNQPTFPKAEWTAKAVRLRIKGWSLRRIGRHLGLDHTTVRDALVAEFERVRPSLEEVATMRAVQREQIDRQLSSWIPRSLQGNKDAALVVARFMDRAAKLDGLDAPTRTEHSGEGGGPIVLNVTSLDDEQLRIAAADDSVDADGATRGGAG